MVMQLGDLGVTAPEVEAKLPEVVAPTVEPVVPQMSGVKYEQGFSNRRLPWYGGAAALAQARNLLDSGHQPTMRQALRQAELDWTVELVPLWATPPNGMLNPQTAIEAPRMGVQRSSDGKVVGVVGNRYEPVQNRRLAEFTDLLVDTGKSSLAGMGEGYGGSKVYSVVKMDEELAIPGMPDEGIGGYLISHNSHDGSTALTVSVVGIRWACTNGLVGTVPGVSHTVKVHHKGNVERKLVEANRLMVQATGYLNKLETLATTMLGQNLSVHRAEDLVVELSPVPMATDDNKRAVANAERRQSELMETYRTSPNLNDIRGTAWGMYNAVVEWDQWVAGNRSRRTRSPMERMMTDQQSDLIPRTMSLLGVG